MANDDGEVRNLQKRLAELESENARLRGAHAGRGRWRAIAAVAIITVGLLLAPVAAVGAWARVQLVDSDRFVATFAPLADQPGVQDFVADQVMIAIEQNVDIPALVGDVIDGVRGLDLPPRADAALQLLEGPAAQGVRSLIDGAVRRVVSSPTFGDVWEQSLRLTHEQAVAVIQDDPAALARLSADGTLSLDLGTLVEAVKERLLDSGVTFASAIPQIDGSIALVQSDALGTVRAGYGIAVTVGFWLPWIALCLLAAGVLLARRRVPALARTALAFAIVFALFALGVGIGRTAFIASVSPSLMPAPTAGAAFDQIVETLLSTSVALALLGGLIALVAWLSGTGRRATAVRGISDRAFASARSARIAWGWSTGRLGVWLDRWHPAVLTIVAAVAVLALLFARPLTIGAVIGALVLVVVAWAAVQLLRGDTAGTHVE